MSLAGGALLANLVSVALLLTETLAFRRPPHDSPARYRGLSESRDSTSTGTSRLSTREASKSRDDPSA